MLPLTSIVLAAAALGPRPALRAERADKPPVIDGRVDEAVWKKAHASSAFTQKLPEDGTAPNEPTTVRILYDDAAVYVAVECVQKKSPIRAPLTRRDRDIESDRVTVTFATRGDGTTAFEFVVNPASVIADATRFNDTDYSRDWDANWTARAAVTKDGWSAELSIPLRVLRFEEKPVQSFGLQVRRYTSTRQETDEWAYIPRAEAGEVSKYGRLDNLLHLKKGSSFEVRPFVLGRIGSRDAEIAPRSKGFSPSFSAGADFKWLVLPSLTLDGAINPDFGQVDADKVVLNLSNFENYLPEKRPFFLEAADVFTTPVQLLYTRRIGLAPPAPAVLDGEEFRAPPDPSPIYGALKLTGTVDEKWSVGALLALSGGSAAEVEDAEGKNVYGRVAAPLAVSKILRFRRNFAGGAGIGLMATGVSRLETPGAYPLVDDPDRPGRRLELCPDGNTLPIGQRCFRNAYALGIDGKHRIMNGDYTITGQVMGTMVQGGPEQTQADGTVIRSGDVSPGGKLLVQKEGGGHIRAGLNYEFYGKNLDFNDLGYMRRQNYTGGDYYVEYDTNGPAGPFNDGGIGVYIYDSYSLDLLNLGRGGGLFAFAQFKNFWRTFLEVNGRADYHDDREIGDGSSLQRPGSVGLAAGMQTQQGGTASLNLFTEPRIYTNGAASVYAEAIIRVRALSQLEFELTPVFTYTTGEPRFYDHGESGYLFGKQEAASVSATLSGTYTFLPTLTLQLYAQAFLAYGRYSNFLSFPFKQGAHPRIFLSQLAADPTPDAGYEAGAFNANVVLRWEYRLGSTVFLVYTHGQANSTDAFKLNFRLVEPRPAADIFLLKASYWWG